MPTATMQGVFPILVSPFDDKGRMDGESLRALVDFNLDAGVHGLGVAIGGEMFKFNEAERGEVTRIVIDQVKSPVPVVINTGAGGTEAVCSPGCAPANVRSCVPRNSVYCIPDGRRECAA